MPLPGISGHHLWRKRSLSILCTNLMSHHPQIWVTSARWRKDRRSGVVLKLSLLRSVTKSTAVLMDLSATTAKQVSVLSLLWGRSCTVRVNWSCCCLTSDCAVYQRWPVCGGCGSGRYLATHGSGLNQLARHERPLLHPCGLHHCFYHLPVPCDGMWNHNE